MKQEAAVIGRPSPTECACAQCVQCCKEQPGSLLPGDYEKIREFLGQSDVSHLFRSSDGALVQDEKSGRQFRVRTIVPLYDRRAKRCIFLGSDDRCTIHAVKPGGCGLVDTHMSRPIAMVRSVWIIKQQQDEEYQELRKTLKVTDHYRPKSF